MWGGGDTKRAGWDMEGVTDDVEPITQGSSVMYCLSEPLACSLPMPLQL